MLGMSLSISKRLRTLSLELYVYIRGMCVGETERKTEEERQREVKK